MPKDVIRPLYDLCLEATRQGNRFTNDPGGLFSEIWAVVSSPIVEKPRQQKKRRFVIRAAGGLYLTEMFGRDIGLVTTTTNRDDAARFRSKKKAQRIAEALTEYCSVSFAVERTEGGDQ